jgi:hypothetical protein
MGLADFYSNSSGHPDHEQLRKNWLVRPLYFDDVTDKTTDLNRGPMFRFCKYLRPQNGNSFGTFLTRNTSVCVQRIVNRWILRNLSIFLSKSGQNSQKYFH